MEFYTFLHRWSEATAKDELYYMNRAYENKYVFMQYEYGLQKNSTVSERWNKVKKIKVGDIIFLRDKYKVYAWSYTIAPRLANKDLDIVEGINCQDIIDNNEHGKYRSDKKYKGYIIFNDCDVFYENLEDWWGQRIDVEEWNDWKKKGVQYRGENIWGSPLSPIKPISEKRALEYVRKLSGNEDFTF